MLTETFIEALLVNEEATDQVWEAWNKGEIGEQIAGCMWLSIVYNYVGT